MHRHHVSCRNQSLEQRVPVSLVRVLTQVLFQVSPDNRLDLSHLLPVGLLASLHPKLQPSRPAHPFTVGRDRIGVRPAVPESLEQKLTQHEPVQPEGVLVKRPSPVEEMADRDVVVGPGGWELVGVER